MMKTTEVAMIAAQAFGLPESHVMEVIRRIREADLYVRETRAIRNRPRATPRHLANLIAALLTGASSRTAAAAVERVNRCRLNGYPLRGFLSDRLGEEEKILNFFYRPDCESDGARYNWSTAPIAHIFDAAIEGLSPGGRCDLSLVDVIEVILEVLAGDECFFVEFASSEIEYKPDFDTASLRLTLSEHDGFGGYNPRYRGEFPIWWHLDFSYEDNDFPGLVERAVTINFILLHRFAKALRRGET